MRRWTIGLTALLVLALITIGVVVATRGNRSSGAAAVERPQVVSMEESGRAMEQAGRVMQVHGQTMLDDGRRANDQDLVAHGEHWLRDGAALIQAGQWMGMNPTAAGSLFSPADISTADRAQLNRAVQNMLHDPSRATGSDTEALRWNGLAMRGEGQNMTDHASVMTEEVALMIERHNLQGQAAADLRAAVQTMRDVGATLTKNGQEMLDYADRLRRSLGLK